MTAAATHAATAADAGADVRWRDVRPGTTDELTEVFYLELLRRPAVDLLRPDTKQLKTVGEYGTVHFAFYEAIRSAVETLRRYIHDPSATRPLNCLILGPPGSGKSFLARSIGRAAGKDVLYLEYNLSRCDGTEQVGAVFEEIVGLNRRFPGQTKLVLLDEFDIRLGGTSMIRYLIQPMYDGALDESRPLGKTAFLFSGGTLKDRSTLETLQRNAVDFDLVKFLFTVYGGSRLSVDENKRIRDFFDAAIKYRAARDRLTPGRDAIEYLRGLDKLPDFLSRVNGFVVELPDLADPLGVTGDPLLLAEDGGPGRGLWPAGTDPRARRALLRNLQDMVEAAERVENAKTDQAPAGQPSAIERRERLTRPGAAGLPPDDRLRAEAEAREAARREGMLRLSRYSYGIESPGQALLVYKNMLLAERYYRVLIQLKKRFGPLAPQVDTAKRVVARTSLLNFLCTAPLLHGMRSLEFLVRELALVPEEQAGGGAWVNRIALDPARAAGPLFRMHVRDDRLYRDPGSLWGLVRDRNTAAIAAIDARNRPRTPGSGAGSFWDGRDPDIDVTLFGP